jgi:hypothetical protein
MKFHGKQDQGVGGCQDALGGEGAERRGVATLSVVPQVVTYRSENIRIISVRRARSEEVAIYES